MHNKLNKGITLVELIIVISIIAILATGGAIAYRSVHLNANRASLKADAQRLADILNTYNAIAGAQINASYIEAFGTWRITAESINNHQAAAHNISPTDANRGVGVLIVQGQAYVVLRMPIAEGGDAAMPPIQLTAEFDSESRLHMALSAIDFFPNESFPDYIPGEFVVNTDWISEWNGVTSVRPEHLPPILR